MLVNFKVKTLDSRTHEFSVDNELTVREFKDKLAEKTNITAENQRLIYQGRVLADERKLSEFDINDRVLHVAERPPNAPRSSTRRNNDEPRQARGRAAGNVRTMPFLTALDGLLVGNMAIPFPISGAASQTSAPSETFCVNRITVARHMLECADNIAAYLENPEVGLANRSLDILNTSRWTLESGLLEIGITLESRDNLAAAGQADPAGNEPRIQAEVVIEDIYELDDAVLTGENPSANNGANGRAAATPPNESEVVTYDSLDGRNGGISVPNQTPNGQRNGRTRTRPNVLGEVVALMLRVQARLGPFIDQYQQLLANDPSFEENDTQGRDNSQRLFDRVSEAFHYLSHAQHAISDLMYNTSQPGPRYLTCRPVVIEQNVMNQQAPSMLFIPPTGRTVFASNNPGNASAATTTASNTGPISASSAEARASTSNANVRTVDAESNTSASDESSTGPSNSSTREERRAQNLLSQIVQTFGTALGNNNSDAAVTDTAEITPPNETATNNASIQREGLALSRLLQNLIGSVGGEGSSVLVHVSGMPGGPTDAPAQSSTNGSSNGSGNGSGSGGSNGRNVTTATLPTTSTQTRSTSRPHIRNVGLPARNARPSIPFDRFLSCNSHHIRPSESTPEQRTPTSNTQQSSRVAHRGSSIARIPRLVQAIVTSVHRRRSAGRSRSPPAAQAGQDNSGNRRRRSILHLRSAMAQRVPRGSARSNRDQHLPAVSDLRTHTAINVNSTGVGASTSSAQRHPAATTTDALVVSEGAALDDLLRNQLSDFLKRFFFEDDSVTIDNIPMARNRVFAWLGSNLIDLLQYERPGYDTFRSVRNVVRPSIDLIVKLFEDGFLDDASDFMQRLSALCKELRIRLYNVLVACLGSSNAELSWRQLMTVLVPSLEAVLQEEAREFLLIYVNPAIPNEPVEVDEFVEYRRPTPTPNLGADTLDTDVEMAELDATEVAADVEAVPPVIPAVRVGAETWHQRFNDDWIPVITNDVGLQSQRQSAQAPFSDAYISGMSPKRRKIVQSNKPPTEVGPLIADNARQAINSTGFSPAESSADDIINMISNDVSLQGPYAEAVRARILERVTRDPDFESSKYPNTNTFVAKK